MSSSDFFGVLGVSELVSAVGGEVSGYEGISTSESDMIDVVGLW